MRHGDGKDQIPVIIEQLKAHGMTALSETQDLSLDVSRKILENALYKKQKDARRQRAGWHAVFLKTYAVP
jgi:hypothetical protein